VNPENDVFKEWCILELMGHRRLGGLVSEAEVGGIPFLRIDIPSDPPVTQFYGKAAVYAMTPTTEEIARAVSQHFHGPVSRYELPAARDEDVDGCIEDDEDDLANIY
jgi:hypothetical protein